MGPAAQVRSDVLRRFSSSPARHAEARRRQRDLIGERLKQTYVALQESASLRLREVLERLAVIDSQ